MLGKQFLSFFGGFQKFQFFKKKYEICSGPLRALERLLFGTPAASTKPVLVLGFSLKVQIVKSQMLANAHSRLRILYKIAHPGHDAIA